MKLLNEIPLENRKYLNIVMLLTKAQDNFNLSIEKYEVREFYQSEKCVCGKRYHKSISKIFSFTNKII
jgi:hypothetical protein